MINCILLNVKHRQNSLNSQLTFIFIIYNNNYTFISEHEHKTEKEKLFIFPSN